MTSRSILVEPLPAEQALHHLRTWFDRPQTQILNPGSRHLGLLATLTAEAGTAGKLTADIHLAAIAIECQAKLCSNDSDFGRFSGLRWSNPLR